MTWVLVRGYAEQQRLAAFYIASETEVPEPEELRSHLRQRLPEYMIPATYERVSSWPLTPTGKLDRQALLGTRIRACAASETTLAGDLGTDRSLRGYVTRVWAETLELDASEPIDLDTTFFDLGGHSLLMPVIHSRLRAELGVEFSLVELFRKPTLRSLVAFLEDVMLEGKAPGGAPLGRRGAAVSESGLRWPTSDRPTPPSPSWGFAGRFPGARDTSELWRNLCAGHEAVRTLSDGPAVRRAQV